MNKQTVAAFLCKQGYTCSYSGHNPRTMYVNTKGLATRNDVQVAVVQEYGILPDFLIEIQ